MHLDPKLKEGDLAFQPRFKGNYRVVSQRGKQVKIWPAEGGETVKFHVTDVKKITLIEQAISQLPDYNKLGRLTKLRLNPKNIPDLDWHLVSEPNTTPILYHTAKINNQTAPTVQTTPTMVTEVMTKMTKLKVD